MPDRLAELRRQRTLIAEHLAWLDREIAAAAPLAAGPALAQAPAEMERISAPVPVTPVVALPESPRRSVLLGGKLVSICPEHPVLPDHDPAHVKENVRRGCFLYVALATLLMALGGALLVWASQAYKAKNPPVSSQSQVEGP